MTPDCGMKVVSELILIKHQQELNFDRLFLGGGYINYIYCSSEQLEMCEKSASKI